MNITEIKVLVLVLMFFVTFIFSVIPVFFVNYIHRMHDSNRRSKYHSALSFMSCIAGGVFMGTCILDLFPDVQEQIDIFISQYTISRPFPLAEFIVVFGFLLVLTLEQIVLDYKEHSFVASIESESQTAQNNSHHVHQSLQLEHSLSGIADYSHLTVSLRESSAPGNTLNCDGHEEALLPVISVEPSHIATTHSPLRSLLLLFALSLHSIFEGMAVGLQSTIDNVLGLFMVVILHKGTLALSLSISMVQSRLSVKQIMLSNLFFSMTAPIGLAVGLGIMEIKDNVAMTLMAGVLQGIACGTFMYVTFFEVLPHELNNGDHRLLKLICIIIGFTIICSMLYIAPDSEKYHCYRT